MECRSAHRAASMCRPRLTRPEILYGSRRLPRAAHQHDISEAHSAVELIFKSLRYRSESASVGCRLAFFVFCLHAFVAPAQHANTHRVTSAVTFYSDVLPVFQKRCVPCHTPGGIGPMPLASYNDARPWAAAIRESVLLRRMPPHISTLLRESSRQW